ncbi:unnamed protein product [Symbiodinium sp. KB8]|nr:unnamed protein product [Symbiodinium sp. KB8]
MPPKLVDDDAMKLLIEKLKQLPQDKDLVGFKVTEADDEIDNAVQEEDLELNKELMMLCLPVFEETGHIWNAPALQKSFATLRGDQDTGANAKKYACWALAVRATCGATGEKDNGISECHFQSSQEMLWAKLVGDEKAKRPDIDNAETQALDTQGADLMNAREAEVAAARVDPPAEQDDLETQLEAELEEFLDKNEDDDYARIRRHRFRMEATRSPRHRFRMELHRRDGYSFSAASELWKGSAIREVFLEARKSKI